MPNPSQSIDCQNIDKLPQEALNLVAWAFRNKIIGCALCHAVEIRLDDPLNNLLKGGEGLILHGGSDSRHYIKHYDNDAWAIIHWRDETWKALPHDKMIIEAEKFLIKT